MFLGFLLINKATLWWMREDRSKGPCNGWFPYMWNSRTSKTNLGDGDGNCGYSWLCRGGWGRLGYSFWEGHKGPLMGIKNFFFLSWGLNLVQVVHLGLCTFMHTSMGMSRQPLGLLSRLSLCVLPYPQLCVCGPFEVQIVCWMRQHPLCRIHLELSFLDPIWDHITGCGGAENLKTCFKRNFLWFVTSKYLMCLPALYTYTSRVA